MARRNLLAGPDPTRASNPLVVSDPYAAPALGQGASSDTTTAAYGATGDAIGQWLAAQRAQSVAMGLLDPNTGLPTPQGMAQAGQAVGSALIGSTAAPGAAGVPGLTAFHGSPHSFDQFQSSAIGTGEGAQAYGHGLYFAGNEAVARSYRDQLSSSNPTVARYVAQAQGDRAAALSSFDRDVAANAFGFGIHPEELDFIRKQIETPPGHMYEVNIASDPAHFLDWDKPLGEQSPHVQNAVKNAGVELPGGWVAADNQANTFNRMGARGQEATVRQIDRMGDGNLEWLANYDTLNHGTGSQRFPTLDAAKGWIDTQAPITGGRGAEVYQRLRDTLSDPQAAQALQNAGIPGIRYLDGGSRASGAGSSNYVVFDPATIAILRKYGIAGLMAGGGAAVADQQQAAPGGP